MCKCWPVERKAVPAPASAWPVAPRAAPIKRCSADRDPLDAPLEPRVVAPEGGEQEPVERNHEARVMSPAKHHVGDEMAPEHDAQGPYRRAEHHRAAKGEGPDLRRRQAGRGDGPEGLARLARHE